MQLGKADGRPVLGSGNGPCCSERTLESARGLPLLGASGVMWAWHTGLELCGSVVQKSSMSHRPAWFPQRWMQCENITRKGERCSWSLGSWVWRCWDIKLAPAATQGTPGEWAWSRSGSCTLQLIHRLSTFALHCRVRFHGLLPGSPYLPLFFEGRYQFSVPPQLCLLRTSSLVLPE